MDAGKKKLSEMIDYPPYISPKSEPVPDYFKKRDPEIKPFTDFKTWFEKKQLEKNNLTERESGGVYIKSSDKNYYGLEQTELLKKTGESFSLLFEKFTPEKRRREIIKMGIDICSSLEMPENEEIIIKPSDISRDKYGNYRLEKNRAAAGGNPVFALGDFMRELLDEDGSDKYLKNVTDRACEKTAGYNPAKMKTDLEYLFAASLEEWLVLPSALTENKAKNDKETKSGIEDIIIPGKYTAIGARAFMRREDLKSVVIPENIERICGFAFGWCPGLESVIFGETGNIKNINIGNFAFWGCENLKSVKIYGTFAENIGDCAFYGSKKLKIDIYGYIGENAESLADRVFFGSRDLEVNVYTGGKRKGKKYDRIFNNRVQFH